MIGKHPINTNPWNPQEKNLKQLWMLLQSLPKWNSISETVDKAGLTKETDVNPHSAVICVALSKSLRILSAPHLHVHRFPHLSSTNTYEMTSLLPSLVHLPVPEFKKKKKKQKLTKSVTGR